MKYVYPAVFYKDKKTAETYSVIFPDVKGAATCGDSLYNAMYMAEDALAGMLIYLEDSKGKIPEPTPIEKVSAKPDEFSEKAFVTLIKVDTEKYRVEVEQVQAEENSEEDWEIPETLAREILKVAGLK